MAIESTSMAIVPFTKGSGDDDFEEKLLAICYEETDVSRVSEDEDDLNEVFPGIYRWSNLNNDVFNIILSMAVEKNNHSIERAKGPKGSLADRLRLGMFNGREVSNVCSSLLFFNFPITLSQRRLRVFDCVLKDVDLIPMPQHAQERFVILNRKRHCRWYLPSRDPRYNERHQVLDVLITAVEDKVVLWTGFNLKHSFTFIMNADYHIRWQFQPCKNDLLLATQILPPPGRRLQLLILNHTVVGQRLIVTIAVNNDPRSAAKREENFVDARAFQMVLDVNTTEWSLLDLNGYTWDDNDVFFAWNERFYMWNISTNSIKYFDFQIGKWVLNGLEIENLRRTFAQLRQIFVENFEEGYFPLDPMEAYAYLILLVASKSGVLYWINKFCPAEFVRYHLVYAMNNINEGWHSVDIFKSTRSYSVYNQLLTGRPHIYWFGTQFRGMSLGPHCWPVGKDSILVLFHKTDFEEEEDSYRYSWYIINERDGIQKFNDVQVHAQFFDDRNFLPVFVESHLAIT
jgi:hypothetical protein